MVLGYVHECTLSIVADYLVLLLKVKAFLAETYNIQYTVYLAYSWGYGEEYHVTISYRPNWMSGGERVLGTRVVDVSRFMAALAFS